MPSTRGARPATLASSASEAGVALRELQDDDGGLARDPRRLADQVLVADEVADDEDRAARETIGDAAETVGAAHQAARRRASTHSTASSRSPATWSGVTAK